MAKKNRGGRPQQITLEVVKRVAERVGLGVPLHYSCLLENNPAINTESFQKALQRNPHFVHPYKAEQAKFLETQFRYLSVHDDWRARVLLLERRHANDFAKPADKLEVTSTIAGVEEPILLRARDYAKSIKRS